MNITILMEPVAKGRPKFTKQGFAYTPTKTRDAEKFIASFLKGYPRFAEGIPLAMEIVFYITRPQSAKKRIYPTCRSDLDNYVKLVLDGCSPLYNDDAQIITLRAAKRYGDPARIEINIEEVTHG